MSNFVPVATHWFLTRRLYRESLNESEASGNMINVGDVPVLSKSEWEYEDRREMQEIVPNLFLGPYAAATRQKLDCLLNTGITHIVCVCSRDESHFIKPNFPGYFTYFVVYIEDSAEENILRYFSSVRDFIDQGLNAGGKVLVHGNTGNSRSATLVVAYVMETYSISCKQAFAYVASRRLSVTPEESFMAKLIEYEPIYKAERKFQNGECLRERSENKRFLEDDQDSDPHNAHPMTEEENMDDS